MKLVQDKITEESRKTIREQLIKSFSGSPDFGMIKQELGSVLQFESDFVENKENDQPSPFFGKGTHELSEKDQSVDDTQDEEIKEYDD